MMKYLIEMEERTLSFIHRLLDEDQERGGDSFLFEGDYLTIKAQLPEAPSVDPMSRIKSLKDGS